MSDSRKEEFLKDLQAVLNKHFADMEVTDDQKPYGMHSGICTITLKSQEWPYCEFNLPTYMTGEAEK